jgi:hypothetical protein
VIHLPDGKDWLLRPWLEGKMQYHELKDGSVDLCDIAEMNEALDCASENVRRSNEAAARKR